MDKWEEAKKRCEKIIELHPKYAEAYNNLAILYEQKNDYNNALKNYAQAVNLQPDYVAAHQNLGLFFMKHGKFNEAMVQFKNVLELDSNILSAHYHLGNLYLGKNELKLAEKHYLQVLSINPEHSDTLSNLGVVYLKKNEPQTAIDYFTKALAFDIDHEDARNNLAATFMQYDRYENAARHYRELLKQSPDNEEYHYNIAVAYMNLGDLEGAIHHFETVIKYNSKHAAAFNNLGAIYWRLDKKDKAREFLSKAMTIDPENKSTQYMLSVATHRDNYKKAPPEYVKNLFDNYAIQYDKHLCQQLQYQLPEKIDKLLKKYFEKVQSILDIGCGTGLLGGHLKKYCETLWGVDLSEKMLENAEKTGYYNKLFCDEIIHFFNESNKKFDIITAGEVLEYFGELEEFFKAIAAHLAKQGVFIFSIELTQEKNFTLQETARFAHNPEYINTLAIKNDLRIIEQIPMTARLQNNQPLSSCLFLLRS